MNPRSAIAAGLRTLLLTNTEIVNKITATDGTIKIFLKIAPGETKPPYILINHVFGGQQYRTPRKEIDALWSVVGVAATQPQAEALDSLIYDMLEGSRPEFSDGWIADQDVSFNGSIAEIDNAQGVQYWSVGGYYRIRAIKNY